MKANIFHYTGIREFEMILKDEYLRSFYHRLAQIKAEKMKVSFNEALEMLGKDVCPNDREWERKSNIYFARDLEKSSWVGASAESYKNKKQVIFGLAVPKKILGDKIAVMLPELSLEHLIEVYAQPRAIDRVKLLLKKEHDGKYGSIPVYSRK